MDLELKGKVAVITGGSRGLGLATAQALAGEGCTVVLARASPGRPDPCGRADRLAVAWPEGGAGHLRRVHARRRRSPDRDGGRRVRRHRHARQQRRPRPRRHDSSRRPMPTGRRRSTQTLFPAIRCSRLAVPHMRQRGGGAIVIVSSIFGREAGGRMTYNAVKAAEISLTKSLAQQLAKDQIRVVVGRARIDPVRRRIVVEAAAGRPARHRRVRQARAAVRPLRHARRSRQRRRVSRLAEGQLDQRHDRRRRRVPVADVLDVTVARRSASTVRTTRSAT